MIGPVCVPAVRWARLNYPEGKKLWHATAGHRAICGHTRFDHPRAEFRSSQPDASSPYEAPVKLCKRCLAKLGRVA
jgi:hypothetical protein